MRKRIATILAFILTLQGALSLQAKEIRARTTLVIQAVKTSEGDEASQKTADLLRKKLSSMPDIYVVDPAKVATILAYYEQQDLGNGFPGREEAARLLAEAKEHYFQLDYDLAEGELTRIVALFENDSKLLFDSGLILRDSYVTRGLVRAARKQKEEAIRDFQQALRLDPGTELSSELFPPSIRNLFDKAMSHQGQTPKGSLSVETFPKVTEVILNGIYRGVSPLTLTDLDIGEHHLTLKANRYQTVRQIVSILPNEVTKTERKLGWDSRLSARHAKKESAGTSWSEVEEGVRMAHLLKVDKVLFVKAAESGIEARFVDRKLRSGLKPISISFQSGTDSLESDIEQMVRLLYAQTQIDLSREALAHLDQRGLGDPILLGVRRGKISRKILWGGVSAVGIGGLVLGLLNVGSGGGEKVGNVSVSFK